VVHAVRVTTADGDEQTYYVRRLEGRLADVPVVKVIFANVQSGNLRGHHQVWSV
jgi:hypothetical protein